MENVKVLIVEDKLLIAEDIASKLRARMLEVVGICDSGEEAVRLSRSEKPDLILMDIELAGAMDGISAASVIHEESAIPIIYLSDFSDQKTFERAKKTGPVNYITKPFQTDHLLRAIDLAFSNSNQRPASSRRKVDAIFLRMENQVYKKFRYDEILCLKAGRAYCKVVTSDKEYTMSSSMSHIHEQLDPEIFIKVHRSAVVNIHCVTSLEGNVVHLRAKNVQMTSDYRNDLLRMLKVVK